MKKMLTKIDTQKALNTRAGRGIFYFLLFTCSILFVFGCGDSLQKTPGPDTAFVASLKDQAVNIVQQGLADHDPRVRVTAIEVVADTRQVKLMHKVQQLLKDNFVPVRFAASLAVGDTKYHPAQNLVEQLLGDRNENVRIAAAYAITRLGSQQGFDILRTATASTDHQVRANAVWLLGKTGNKQALELLYWALEDKDSDYGTRLQAAEAIAKLGDERIYRKLWAILISAYADDRVMGVRAMGALGTEQAKNALITMLDDDLLEVRLTAAAQLGTLGYKDGEPEVLDVFNKNLTNDLDKKDDIERVNVLTAMAIGRIGSTKLTRFLPRLLQNESKFVRLAAARAVLLCLIKK